MMALLLIQKHRAKYRCIYPREWQKYFRSIFENWSWPCSKAIDNRNNQHYKYKSL